MGIRQRKWTWKGREKSAWVVEYLDAKRKRRLKTFQTKREALDWAAETRIDLKQGTHVADGDSITVAEAGKLWLADCKARDDDERLEKATLQQYRQHVELHIVPFIGTRRLNEITAPAIRTFQDQLRDAGRSAAMRRKIVTSLGSILADAIDRGLTMRNPVHERKRRRKRKSGDRHEERLEIGRDIPSPAETKAILVAATRPSSNRFRGFRRAFFATAALVGLRSSELRELRWQDVDFAKATITVRQRADQWGSIDSPKAASSRRTIPMPLLVVSALKEWKLVCPKRDTGKKDANGQPIMELHFVFPNGKGKVESQQNIVKRHWHPLQVAAGVSVPGLDENGNPIMETDTEGKPVLDNVGRTTPVMQAKYSGLHALRHFFCSWCTARPQDRGLGLPLKTVQVRMGHSTLAMTADRYGHLFPSQDDAEVLAAGERALMGV